MDKIKIILLSSLLTGFLCSGAAANEDDEMVLHRANTGAQVDATGSLGESVQPPSEKVASSLRVTGAWLLLLGLGGGALIYISRRRNAKGCEAGSKARLAVVERVSLGAQRELLLVRACDRLLVVAAHNNQMSLLSDLPSESSPSQPFPMMISETDIPMAPLENRVAKEYAAEISEKPAAPRTKGSKPWPNMASTGMLS